MSVQSWVETLYTIDAAGPDNTAAAAGSMLPTGGNVYTFPAGYFNRLGQQVLVKASGQMSSVITTPGTARIDFRLGGTVVFDTLAILLDATAAHVAVPWTFEALLTLRAKGTAANFIGAGEWKCEAVKGTLTMPVTDGLAVVPWNATPAVGTNFDATAAKSFDVQWTQTVNTGHCILHQLSLISLN